MMFTPFDIRLLAKDLDIKDTHWEFKIPLKCEQTATLVCSLADVEYLYTMVREALQEVALEKVTE